MQSQQIPFSTERDSWDCIPAYRAKQIIMEALYLLIPLSIVIVFIAIWIFLHMSEDGQFDDMVGPALRIVQDDDRPANLPPGGKE